VREHPHPYPAQVLQSLSVLALLQELQQLGQDPPRLRQLIVVTTTLARTFQKLHMLGLINSLRSARCPSAGWWWKGAGPQERPPPSCAALGCHTCTWQLAA